MFIILSHQGNASQNYFGVSSSTYQKWLRSIIQVTANAGNYMEQGEHFPTADGSANLHSHYGNQYGGYSEKWKLI